MSMVSQSYAVFPHRKVRYNIELGLVMARGRPRGIERKVHRRLTLQLAPYLDRLSGPSSPVASASASPLPGPS